MHLFCSFMYHDNSSCSLLKRMRRKRKKTLPKLLKLPKYYPRDSILVLSEIRSTADRLVSDSVLNVNN